MCAWARMPSYLSSTANGAGSAAADRGERTRERLRQRLLDLRFLETDAQLAAEELEEIACLERTERPEHLPHRRTPRVRATGVSERPAEALDGDERRATRRPRGQHLAGEVAEIAMGDVALAELRLV